MVNEYQIVHDLALVYAKQQFEEFCNRVDVKERYYPTDVSKLVELYISAIPVTASWMDGIEKAYLDDDGSPMFDLE